MHFIAILIGFGLMLFAASAYWIGIDKNPDWGNNRTILFWGGFVLAALSGTIRYLETAKAANSFRKKYFHVYSTIKELLNRIRHSTAVSVLLTCALFISISIFALWYTTNAKFPYFERVINPYVELGEAFLHGQVHLLEIPDPRLVALENPYDYEQRKNIPYRWDLTYYKGKYYLYWGPVPALAFMLVQGITGVQPPDQMVVIFCVLGMGVIVSILLFQIRKWYFPHAPGLAVPLFLLAFLVNLPFMYLLESSQVYETSIASGQFFLMLGVTAWLFYLNTKKLTLLLVASLCWGLAVGSRHTLVISVVLIWASGLFFIWRDFKTKPIWWKHSLALIIPLALCGLCLSLYNFVRFGNPVETGFSYQLTIPVYQNQHYSPAFVLSNLYIYLFYPPLFPSHFPLISLLPLEKIALPSWVSFSSGKVNENVYVGIFFFAPLFWLLVIQGSVLIIRKIFSSVCERTGKAPFTHRQSYILYISRILVLAGLLQFIFLLFYYFTAMRFHLDFYFQLLLAIYIWSLAIDRMLIDSLVFRAIHWTAIALLILYTAGFAILAGFDIPPQLFRIKNPTVFYAISDQVNLAVHNLHMLSEDPGIVGVVIRGARRFFGLP